MVLRGIDLFPHLAKLPIWIHYILSRWCIEEDIANVEESAKKIQIYRFVVGRRNWGKLCRKILAYTHLDPAGDALSPIGFQSSWKLIRCFIVKLCPLMMLIFGFTGLWLNKVHMEWNQSIADLRDFIRKIRGLVRFGATSGITWSHFFKNEAGAHVTFNGDRYPTMINGRLFENMDDIYQQEGAAWHTATAIIDLLQSKFGDNVISRSKPVIWLPRLCDLITLVYFL